MILGVMQPYIFPYLGYFQLINSVDKFVIYDDVNYIRQGWINRNRILVNNKPYMFSIPVDDTSSFRKIKDITISIRNYTIWREKFFKTLKFNYSKAPYYDFAYNILNDVFITKPIYLMDIVVPSILKIVETLDITTQIIRSPSKYNNNQLHKEFRLYDICKKENTNIYINAIGGQSIYNKLSFAEHNIELKFIKSTLTEYNHNSKTFIPDLSIIDVMMFNSVEKIKEMIGEYELI